jgi:hypothetical protein
MRTGSVVANIPDIYKDFFSQTGGVTFAGLPLAQNNSGLLARFNSLPKAVQHELAEYKLREVINQNGQPKDVHSTALQRVIVIAPNTQETSQLIGELARNGADVNFADEGGNTLLELATIRGHQEKVKALISAGANALKINNKGCKASELAGVGTISQQRLLDEERRIHNNRAAYALAVISVVGTGLSVSALCLQHATSSALHLTLSQTQLLAGGVLAASVLLACTAAVLHSLNAKPAGYDKFA